MQQDITFNPHFERIFRHFIGLQMMVYVFIIVLLGWRSFRIENDMEPKIHLLLLPVLYLYLSSKWLHHKMGQVHFPIALLLIAIEGPAVQAFVLRLYPPDDPDVLTQIVAFSAAPNTVLLLLPLMLLASQADLHYVFFFTIASTILAVLITLIGAGAAAVFNGFYITMMIFRLIILTLHGYFVYLLVNVERKQRHELKSAHEKLTQYAATLEELSVTRERSRLARELHDTLAHVQSGVAVQLEAVDTLWQTDPAAAHQLLQKSIRTVRSGMSETRRALQALRASPLETQGLVEAIRAFAAQLRERVLFNLELRLPETIDGLPEETEQAIYRIVQEALTNIERHAQAKQACIQIETLPSGLMISVKDDGRGFVREKVNTKASFGLRGMEEWADLIGATLKVQSQIGQGTQIQLKVNS